VDFPLQPDRIVQPHASCQLRLDLVGKIRGEHQPLARRQDISIVNLFNFRANPCLAQEFLCRDEVIQQRTQGAVNPGKRAQFPGAGETPVADEVADVGVVLLLHVAVVVLAVGPVERVNMMPTFWHHFSSALLMNSAPLSLSMPRSGNGRESLTSASASKVHLWALFGTARNSVQPEYTSVEVRVSGNSPESEVPQWCTVSFSKNPGFLSESAYWTRTGIWFFRRFPGFVPLLPFSASLFLSARNTRSIVAGLTESGSFFTSGLMRNGPSRNRICSRMKGASIFPHRYQKNAQMARRATANSPE